MGNPEADRSSVRARKIDRVSKPHHYRGIMGSVRTEVEDRGDISYHERRPGLVASADNCGYSHASKQVMNR
jgi:hypothetical protein